MAVVDVDLGLALVGLGDSQVGPGRLDVHLGSVAVGSGLVARGVHLGDQGVGLIASGGGLLELAIRFVADLHIEDALSDKLFEPLGLRLPAGVAGLGSFDAGLGRDDSRLGGLELRLGSPQSALSHADLDRGPLHGGRLLGELLEQVGNPHLDQDITRLDSVADVVSVLLDVAGDPGVNRRHFEGLDRPRLDDRHPDVAPFGTDDRDPGGLALLALGPRGLGGGGFSTPVGVSATGRKQESQGDERPGRAREDGAIDRGHLRLSRWHRHGVWSPAEVGSGAAPRRAGGGHGGRHRPGVRHQAAGWRAGRRRGPDGWGHSGCLPGRPGRARGTGWRPGRAGA